jgi:hypothetical protein
VYYSIERRYIQSPSVFRCDTRSSTQIGFYISILRIFDNPLGYLLSARGTVVGALCADGFFGYVWTTSVLSASVSDFMVQDGELSFSGISWGWHTPTYMQGLTRIRI